MDTQVTHCLHFIGGPAHGKIVEVGGHVPQEYNYPYEELQPVPQNYDPGDIAEHVSTKTAEYILATAIDHITGRRVQYFRWKELV